MSLIVPLLSDDEVASVSAYVAALKQWHPGRPVAPALRSARSPDGTGREIGQAFNLFCPNLPINPLSNGKRPTSIDPQDLMSLRALSL